MNKAYRVIWSKVRGGFIVVGENTKARGKPKSTRLAIAAAVGAAFLAPGIALASPCAGPNPVTTIVTTPQCYGNQNVTVNSGAGVTVVNGNTAVFVSANPYTGSFANNGTISATAGSGYGVNAYGLNFGGTLSGSLTNAGTIRAVSSLASVSGYAYGVYIGGDLSGTLTNSGTISAAASAPTTAKAYGVQINNLSGTLNNSGTISATATHGGSGYGVANAYGVYANGGITSTGTLTNSGTISATANASGNSANSNAYGVYVSGSVDGSFANAGSGSISAVSAMQTGSGYAVATAYGVYLGSDIAAAGAFNNAGTISAKASQNGGNSRYATAVGVQLNSNLAGSFTNTGTISAVANGVGGSGDSAYGVRIFGTMSGTFINSAVISATATSSISGGASATGVQINNNLDGIFTNGGTISASAVGRNASAMGVSNFSTLNGTLNNSGTISVVANGVTGGQAYGVYVSTLSGVVNNSGTISAKGLGAVSDASVYSIYANSGTGTINNLAGGLLDGKVFAGGSVNLNNAGTIDTRMQGSSVGGNYTQSATGVLKFGATSNAAHGSMNVTGTANLAAGTTFLLNAAAGNTLTAGTMSSVLTSGGLTMPGAIVNKNFLALSYAAMANGNNVDLVATPTGLTTVAAAVGGGSGSGAASVLDSLLANVANQPQPLQNFLYSLGSQTTAQGVADSVSKILPLINTGVTQVGVGASQGISNVVLARLEGAQGRSAGDKFYGDKRFWLKPFGSWANQDDRNGVSGYAARTAGMVGGADAEVGDANRLGLAFGYARSNVDSNSTVAPQNAKVDSYQLMAYGSHKLDPATDANFQAGVGLHNNDGRRSINFGGAGFVASSAYSSWSANLGGGVARTMKWNESTSFTPSLRADYTWIRNRSYIENGAGALNLNVSGNNAAKFIIAADGKFSHELSGETKLVGNVGLGYDLIHKSSSVTSAFAGAPGAAFSTQGITPSALLLRGGAGAVFRAREGVEVTARYDLEARAGFTNQTASVNVRWAF